jgi:hypothetical protein
MTKKLSIGMAHHNDFDGAWFTIQDIRKELIHNGRKDLLDQIEFVIIENCKKSKHAVKLREFAASNLATSDSLKYSILSNEGTGIAKDEIFKIATGDFVLVLDCHVLLCPTLKVIEKLFDFMEDNPKTNDLYNGPLVYNNGISLSTHFRNQWSSGMWGTWATAWKCACEDFYFDVRKKDEEIITSCAKTGDVVDQCPCCGQVNLQLDSDNYLNQLNSSGCSIAVSTGDEEPFEIYGQGTGCFFVRKDAWLGYNKYARGFGGEECYIHEKFRKAGNKTICLPFLKWLHRFDRVQDPSYPLEHYYKVRNYILEFIEIDLDLNPIYDHFVVDNGFDEIVYNSFVREAKYLYNRD